MNLEEVKQFVYETLTEAFGKLNVNVREDGTVWLREGSALIDIVY